MANEMENSEHSAIVVQEHNAGKRNSPCAEPAMQLNQFLVLAIVTFIACCSTVTTAKNVAQSQNLEAESNREVVDVGRRYLKVGEKTIDVNAVDEERVGATTPSFMQFLGLFKRPKFKGLSKLPLIKQINAIRQKFGTEIGDLYLQWAKKRYHSNQHNFM